MILKCKYCKHPIDVPDQYVSYAFKFARKFDTRAEFLCESCAEKTNVLTVWRGRGVIQVMHRERFYGRTGWCPARPATKPPSTAIPHMIAAERSTRDVNTMNNPRQAPSKQR